MALLSVLCITYNQKDYIKQCLDSIVMQKTNFEFEVLINDDCSTDGTIDIIKEYQKKYPDIIKPVFNEKNLGSFNNYFNNLKRAKTKYVAICDGDDYFLDENKLQKQVDFLEKNPEYSGCFHKVKVIWESNKKHSEIYPPKKLIKNKQIITPDNLLKRNLIQTNSVVYRWRFIDENIEKYFPLDIQPADWYLHLLHLKIGNFRYFNDVMSVYRRNENGIWSFDADLKILKYGIKEIKFYYNVWKNIALNKDEYLNKVLLPKMKTVTNTYYQNNEFEKLYSVINEYPNLVKQLPKYDAKNIYVRYQKYKKLFTVFLILSIVLVIIIIVYLMIKYLSN